MVEAAFEGQVAVVTGAASGIGRATSLELARAGAAVVAVDVDRDPLDALTGSAAALQLRIQTIVADVSRSGEVRSYVDRVLERHGRIDVFINNAGITMRRPSPIWEADEQEFEELVAVNVRGVFLGLRHVLPQMIARRAGSVVNTASVSGLKASPGWAPYVATKHAVIGLTRGAAVDAASRGVRVNAVCPGPIRTALMDTVEHGVNPTDPASVTRQVITTVPAGRYGDPEEVARVIAFLASDAASYVNGGLWTIDGGITCV